jgi:hypothetical protein
MQHTREEIIMLETPAKLRPKNRLRLFHSLAGANLNDTNALKEKLMREMLELDKQRAALETGASKHDFSMVQTYKEMIHSRRVLLDQLNSAATLTG